MSDRQLGPLTYSPQKGKAGHCFAAQVWGPDGKNLAIVEGDNDPAVATAYARLFAASPEMAESIRDILAAFDANDSRGIGEEIERSRTVLRIATEDTDTQGEMP